MNVAKVKIPPQPNPEKYLTQEQVDRFHCVIEIEQVNTYLLLERKTFVDSRDEPRGVYLVTNILDPFDSYVVGEWENLIYKYSNATVTLHPKSTQASTLQNHYAKVAKKLVLEIAREQQDYEYLADQETVSHGGA